MSLTAQNLETLGSYGYAQEEARFLFLVVAHSGYFRAGQYQAFTRRQRGAAAKFWAKLETRKHARIERFATYGPVYHVFAQKLYQDLGFEALRSRREHEIEHVERRIGALDFILGHPEFEYLDSESEKQAYFEAVAGVPRHLFPSRTYDGPKFSEPAKRYFVDRFPMFLLREPSGSVVTFSYVEPAQANRTEFKRHIERYLPLFRELPSFRFLYLARSGSQFDSARELFASLVTIPLGSSQVNDLLRYFAIRRAWDLREYGSVSEADLLFRNQARRQFAAPRFELLYQAWKTGRKSEAGVREDFRTAGRTCQVDFLTEVLKPASPNEARAESEE